MKKEIIAFNSRKMIPTIIAHPVRRRNIRNEEAKQQKTLTTQRLHSISLDGPLWPLVVPMSKESRAGAKPSSRAAVRDFCAGSFMQFHFPTVPQSEKPE